MPAPVTPAARRPDRTSPNPLWAQVSADLRRRCDAGDFAEGVPGEFALCEEYGVSRHTIREALRVLRAEGRISSGRGRGSVVRGRYSQSLGAIYSLFQSIEEQGAEQASDVLRLETTTEPSIAARLGLAPDALLVVLERVRRADAVPLAHDTSWLPHSLAHPLLTEDFHRTALYAVLAGIGVTIDSGHEWMTATTADATIAELLDIPEGDAILQIDRLATAEGRPVEWRQTQVRGETFTVETDWTTAGVSLSLSGSPAA